MLSRTMKISLIVLLAVAVISAVTIPWLNRIKHKQEIDYRSNNLRIWYEGVKLFIRKTNRLPSSLYEVHHDRVKEGYMDRGFVVSSDGKISGEQMQNLLDDPQQFEEIVKYGLFADRYGWVIRELKHGTIYTKMLMIDQNGTIYQVQEIPKNE